MSVVLAGPILETPLLWEVFHKSDRLLHTTWHKSLWINFKLVEESVSPHTY